MSPNPQETEDLVTFTGEVRKGKWIVICEWIPNAPLSLLLSLNIFNNIAFQLTETVVRICASKSVFLKISKYSQEIPCAFLTQICRPWGLFLIKLQT